MLLSEDSEEHLFKRHQDLCNKLSLDDETLQQAWESFLDIKSNTNLEGDLNHWLGCAVFVACRNTTVETVGHTVIEGNCVNLTSLLRHCNLSLTQFFNKITKWVDMAHMTEDMRQKIKRLESNFAVSYHVFKKFIPIFSEVFKGPVETELIKQAKNRKQSVTKGSPSSPTKVFEFCWILFTTVKGEIPSCSEDIVESYHLLQACCDLAFKNAFLDDRKDLINPTFQELPSNWSEPTYVVPSEAPCIIDYLCKYHNGISTEAKYVKEYSWKNQIKNLFLKGILQGNEDNFTKLFNTENFEVNLRNVTKTYEVYLLNKGHFDERIFLGEVNLTDTPNSSGLSDSHNGTPRASNVNEGSSPFESKHVSRLQALLTGRQPAPSESLIQIYRSCTQDPMERIKHVVQVINEQFCKEFTMQVPNLPTFSYEFASQKFQLATTLFYRFVENIFLQERLQRRDISNLAQQDIFYKSTLACCLEIITYCYNCQRKFPWILSALNLQPFYFVRVIELIVRLQEQLPRDVVKHLNMVEQKIIEALIWKSESPIWNVLKTSDDEFPKFQDIALPGKIMQGDKNVTESIAPRTPRRLSNEILSPGPSAVDRFQSPISNSDFRRYHYKSTQVIVDKDGIKQFLPLVDQANLSSSNKPRRTGSLSIILRKFYNLAYSRLEHLCMLLNINDIILRQKIFTVFEYSVRVHTDLMRDRHLDQLLMCAVYVVCKVADTKERKFAEIMEYYRVQPQAKSHVYRNVLIERCPNQENQAALEIERRGDLILFYNTVYIQVIRSFALQFSSNSNQNVNVPLSPLPLLVNSHLVSPRLQISNNVFISSCDVSSTNISKGKTLEYHFSRSPSKDLEKINTAINKSIVGKRILGNEAETEPPSKRVNRKVQSLFEERRSQICD